MLNIKIITIGTIKENYFNDAVLEYIKRLKPYAKINFVELKAEAFNDSNKEQIKKIEAEKIENALKKCEKKSIFLLDERGSLFDSKEFAKFIDKNQCLVFVIGGSLGFSEELLKKYKKVSLSNLTFLHEMVRVILLEQIYRSITIINKKNYHH